MAPILSLSSLSHSVPLASLGWWLARVTVLAGIACAYLAIARTARPALRHLVAMTSLVALALLPVASGMLPSWSLPVLRASSVGVMDTRSTTGRSHSAIDPSTRRSEQRSLAPVRPAPIDAPEPAAGTPSPLAHGSAAAAVDWKRVAFLLWLNVMIALLLHLRVAAIGARRYTRRARAVSEERLMLESARAHRVLRLARTVDVAVSPDVAIPVAVGVLRPRVVLPESATEWSRDRLSVVLLHELAHVRRRDALWVVVAQVVTAILWFHPLAWVLSRHVRRESERACDDIVLASGVRGSDYAGHLVSIARMSMVRDPLPGSTLAFATRSTLERRVTSILSSVGPRPAMSRRARSCAACVALALFGVIAVLQPTAVTSAQLSPVEVLAMNGLSSTPSPVPQTDTATQELVQTEKAAETRAAVEQRTDTATQYQYRYEVAKNRNDSGRDAYQRAHELYDSKHFDRAAEAYEEAARLDYNRATALYNAGCSYALANQSGKAIDALERAFDEGFDEPEMYAKDEDLNSLRGDPKFKKLLDTVMNSDTAQQDRRAAGRDYDRLAARKDVDDGDWNSVGIDLMRSGDYDRAMSAFDREYQVSHDTDAIYNQACVEAIRGNKDSAFKLLEKAITTGTVNADHMADDPDLASLHKDGRFDKLQDLADDLTLYGGSWSWSGKDDERHWRKALPRFEKVASDHPEIGRAWFNLGYAQLEAGDADKSIGSFKKALDLGYQKPTTLYNLACSTAQTGDIDASFGYLKRADDAGMNLAGRARWDDDLDPLRADPRWKELNKKWRSESKHSSDWDWGKDKDKDKDKNKDKDQDKDKGANFD